jgi:hypothetical protein
MSKRKPKLFIPEILDKIAKAKTPQDKADVCFAYENKSLKLIFAYAFNPTIELAVTAPLKYKSDPRPMGETLSRLEQAALQLPIFRVDRQTKKKPEKLYAMLSGLSKEEGAVLAAVVRKDLQVDGVDINFLNQVWPDLKIPDDKENETTTS